MIETGHWLVEVEIDPSLPQRADAQDTGHSHGHKGAGRPVPDEPSRDDGDDLTVIASDEGGEIRDSELAELKELVNQAHAKPKP